MNALLKVEELTVLYGAVQALTKVSLTVAQGEAIAILGANGAGKTTLLRALSGLTRRQAGTIYLDGRVISKTSRTSGFQTRTSPRARGRQHEGERGDVSSGA
jgi:branched-chain amino acid transport system ATP-binding protein